MTGLARRIPGAAPVLECLGNLAGDRRGAIAMMFGACVAVWFMMLTAGIEFTELMQAKAALQNQADAEAIATVVQYGQSNVSDFAIIETTYINSGIANGGITVIPSTLSNVLSHLTLSTTGYPNTSISYESQPFVAAVTITATYTPPFTFLGTGTIPLSVTATGVDPTPNAEINTGCNTNAGDYDYGYWYPVPRGMYGTYIPSLSSTTHSYNLLATNNPSTTSPYAYVPTTSGSNLMFSNGTANTCSNTATFKQPAGTAQIGFAVADVTGKVAGSGCEETDYIQNNSYFTENGAYTGNADYPANGNSVGNMIDKAGTNCNDQYGNPGGYANWMFSTTGTEPPTIATDSITASNYVAGVTPEIYTACGTNTTAGIKNCAGGAQGVPSAAATGNSNATYMGPNTGLAAPFAYDYPPKPGNNNIGGVGDSGAGTWNSTTNQPSLTDNALQIYQCSDSSGNAAACQSGTAGNTGYALDTVDGNTVIEYYYEGTTGGSPPYGPVSSPIGKCNIQAIVAGSKEMANNNYCTVFSSTTDPYQTVNQLGYMDCIANAGNGYVYLWNDMGGTPEDLNYDNMNYFWNCEPSINTNNSHSTPQVSYWAFLSN